MVQQPAKQTAGTCKRLQTQSVDNLLISWAFLYYSEWLYIWEPSLQTRTVQ